MPCLMLPNPRLIVKQGMISIQLVSDLVSMSRDGIVVGSIYYMEQILPQEVRLI